MDRDVERMARHVISKHGRAAGRVAQQRAQELADAGDSGAAKVWRDIANAIATIERKD
jgi:hypothetical protein